MTIFPPYLDSLSCIMDSKSFQIDIGAAEGVGPVGVSPPFEIFFNFKHSKIRFPVSSGFIFMFYLNLFRLK